MQTAVKEPAQSAALSMNDMAAGLNAAQAGQRCRPEDYQQDLGRLPEDQARSWAQDGFFIIRGLVDPALCTEMTRRVIELFIEAEADSASASGHHLGANGVIAVEEAALVDSGAAADLRMSKLYNIHRKAPFAELAGNPVVKNAMQAILGPKVACFNSQYIFKNPGVWGQPWHQDSLYYTFDKTPQVGMWLATSPATVANGCLFVAPGSHREPIHEVVPDRRPNANFGYLEVVDYDFSGAVPVTMETGDVLIFHSFLMHMSNDNTSTDRRSALVYHYARSDTQVLGNKSVTIDFMDI